MQVDQVRPVFPFQGCRVVMTSGRKRFILPGPVHEMRFEIRPGPSEALAVEFSGQGQVEERFRGPKMLFPRAAGWLVVAADEVEFPRSGRPVLGMAGSIDNSIKDPLRRRARAAPCSHRGTTNPSRARGTTTRFCFFNYPTNRNEAAT